jgi:hypothetical protein
MGGKNQFLIAVQPPASGNGMSSTMIDAKKTLYGIINAGRSIEGLYCEKELLKKDAGWEYDQTWVNKLRLH